MATRRRRRKPDVTYRPKPLGEPSPVRRLESILIDLCVAAALAVLTFWLYRLTAGVLANRQSGDPQFVLLADAYLHLRFWLDPLRAARLGDITPWNGHFYVSFPPMPAVLMLPFVARVGPTFNDVLFSIALGSTNVALLYLLIRRLSVPGFASRQGIEFGRLPAVAASALFGFGTVHFDSALLGSVWYMAHIVYDFFLLLYLRECVGSGRPLVAGLALAGAALTRPTAIFAGLFWLALALGRREQFRTLALRVVTISAPLAVALVFLLWQNQVRFGSPTDFGYFKMRVADTLAPRLLTYGQFSTHFLGDNLSALFTAGPLVNGAGFRPWLQNLPQPGGIVGLWTALTRGGPSAFPISWDPWGAGLWAVSPAVIFALRPPDRRTALVTVAAWLAIIAVAIPDLLYYNTGWGQYGYRFALDFLPIVAMLVALGLRRPLAWGWAALFVLLLLASLASNWLGARWFMHLPPYAR